MRRFQFCQYFDIEGGGGNTPAAPGSGAPSGSPTGPSGTTTPSTSTAPAAPGSAPAIGSTRTASPAVKQYSYTEDRSNWVKPDEFTRVQGELRTLGEREARLRAMLEAGAGVKVPGLEKPMDPAVKEARELFLTTIFPELQGLLKLAAHADSLGSIAKEFPQLQETFKSSEQEMWNGRGEQAVNTVFQQIAKDAGVEQLTPFQQTAVGNTFINWLQLDPKRLSRYGRGDTGVVNEFVTEFRSGMIDPFRRAAQGALGAPRMTGQRQQLPPAPRRGGAPPPAGTRGKPLSEDEVHDAAWKAFEAASH